MSLVERHPETHGQRQEPEDTYDYDYDYDLNEPPTPLPKLALLSVFLIQTAEPITATVIYPFINQFVRETGITNGDEKKTGYYAGFIVSAILFFLQSGRQAPSDCFVNCRSAGIYLLFRGKPHRRSMGYAV